jgi:hypothetical protein
LRPFGWAETKPRRRSNISTGEGAEKSGERGGIKAAMVVSNESSDRQRSEREESSVKGSRDRDRGNREKPKVR